MSSKTLNVLFNGFGNRGGLRLLEQAFQPFRLGSCIAICGKKSHTLSLQTEVPIFCPHTPLESIDWEGIRPLDAEIIEALSECEAICLKMMDRRGEARGKVLSYPERKRVYLQALRFWNHWIREKNINLFVSASMPHRMHQYVMYSLCKYLNIDTLFFQEHGFVSDALFLMDNWRNPLPALKEEFLSLQKQYGKESAGIPLTPRFQQYYDEHVTEKSNPTPWYRPKGTSLSTFSWWQKKIRNALRTPNSLTRKLFPVLRRWCRPSHWSVWWEQHRSTRRARSLLHFYDSHAEKPDLSQKFIYVALHYQPECSTCPMGGVFVDQILLVRLLQASIPSNVILYVKEHPNQGEMCRDQNFYQDLLSIENVRFVPRTFDTFELLKHCKAVATVTGTVGFEALFRQKPVLMFGYRFYQYAPGVFPVHSVDECGKALEKILKKDVRPKLTDARLFLKALENICIEGYTDPDYMPISRISEEQVIHNVAQALEQEVTKRFPHLVS